MRIHLLPLAMLGLAIPASAQIYSNLPEWESADQSRIGTGGAFVDLDRDGWLDFVVANGNDISRNPVVVYYNNGDGTFPTSPDWTSSDTDYHGHMDVADVNGDGWPDIAVSVLGTFTSQSNAAKVYLNNAGTLSSLPDWEAAEVTNCFGVAFGDVNNDGRPDLAVATGWPYSNPHADPSYVHLNVDGALEETASWQTDDTWDYNACLWTDADDDGWLDLVCLGANTDTWMYRNLGGTLDTTATWRTTDNGGQFAIMGASGDVNGDGLRELFITDNTQLFSGTGLLRQYDGQAGGDFSTTPDWSYFNDYGSAVALADVNADGLLDMVTGAWWDRPRLFLNDGDGFGSTPDWQAGTVSVVEKIVFGDVDADGVRSQTVTFDGDGQQRLFYLGRQPIREITAVDVDGIDIDFDWTFSRENGWITVEIAPNDFLEVRYTWSNRLDMGVTNWDGSEGAYLFYNLLGCEGDLDGDGDTGLSDLSLLLAEFGCATGCSTDLDGDGDTDLSDLSILLASYGCTSD